MDIDNVVDIWTYSTNFNLLSLQSAVLEFVGNKLLAIDPKVMLRFDGEFMRRLLEEAVIGTVEGSVLAVAVQWLDFNWKCREKYAKNLLQRIYWDRIHLRDQRAVAVRCSKPLRNLLTDAGEWNMTLFIIILFWFYFHYQVLKFTFHSKINIIYQLRK